MQPPQDCIFYQSVELPGVGLIEGAWDHRGTVDEFLGHTDFTGKTVLDVGPGNGFFSFEMEKRGGRVTAVDLGETSPWDVVPHPYAAEGELVRHMRHNVRKVENAFWYAHRTLGSKVALVYGSVYDVPNLVQETDIALMSNVLQHFRDPFLAIQRIAKVTTQTLLITETLWHEDPTFLDTPSMLLIPRASTPEVSHSWWQVSPRLVVEALRLLGFPSVTLAYHHQKFNGASSDRRPRMVKHFTVTAHRALPVAAGGAAPVGVEFAHGFHDPEADEMHAWRWSPGPSASISLSNATDHPIDVGLVFGLTCINPAAHVTVRVGAKQLWEGTSFYGTRPVSIAKLALPPGRTAVELLIDTAPTEPTDHDARRLNFAVYDFMVCQPLE